jgi:hypothetical protein
MESSNSSQPGAGRINCRIRCAPSKRETWICQSRPWSRNWETPGILTPPQASTTAKGLEYISSRWIRMVSTRYWRMNQRSRYNLIHTQAWCPSRQVQRCDLPQVCLFSLHREKGSLPDEGYNGWESHKLPRRCRYTNGHFITAGWSMPSTWGSLVWILHKHQNALIFAPRTRLSQLSEQTAPTTIFFHLNCSPPSTTLVLSRPPAQI